MIYTIDLQWKEFNVDAESVKAHILTIDPNCAGVCSNSCLQVRFPEEPTQQVKDDIQAYWDAITQTDDEAVNYRSKDQIAAAKLALKLDAVNKTWTGLSAIQKKILLGLEPTKAEMIDAGVL